MRNYPRRASLVTPQACATEANATSVEVRDIACLSTEIRRQFDKKNCSRGEANGRYIAHGNSFAPRSVEVVLRRRVPRRSRLAISDIMTLRPRSRGVGFVLLVRIASRRSRVSEKPGLTWQRGDRKDFSNRLSNPLTGTSHDRLCRIILSVRQRPLTEAPAQKPGLLFGRYHRQLCMARCLKGCSSGQVGAAA
jgi:hypothetical protein